MVYSDDHFDQPVHFQLHYLDYLSRSTKQSYSTAPDFKHSLKPLEPHRVANYSVLNGLAAGADLANH